MDEMLERSPLIMRRFLLALVSMALFGCDSSDTEQTSLSLALEGLPPLDSTFKYEA
jgi:hypothetical protein